MNDLRDTLGVAFSVVVWPFLLYAFPRYWRNARGLHADTPPPGWPLTLATWRAFARVWPVIALSFIVAIPFVFVAQFTKDGSVPFAIAMVVLACVALVWFIAVPAVILFNRPRFLVAPHHRSLPGWLAERRGAPVPPTPEPTKPPRWHLAPR